MEYEEGLRAALVGDRYRSLYLHSAGFKAAIDGLSMMLPFWIKALADQARETDGRRLAEVELLTMEMSDDQKAFISELIGHRGSFEIPDAVVRVHLSE